MPFLPMVKFDEFLRIAEQHRAIFMVRTMPLYKEVITLPLDAAIAPGGALR